MFSFKVLKKNFRIFFFLILNFFFKEKSIIKSFGIYKLCLNINEYTSWSYILNNKEKDEVKFIKKNFTSNCNAIDIGANLGFYTSLFASLSPLGKVFAFEPELKNFQKLKKNIKLNNFNNVNANKLGISNYSGEGKLILTSEINEGGHFINNRGSKDKVFKSEKIFVDTADNYFAKSILFFQFVKIDVEGHELEVLQGMTNLLKNKVKFIIIETYGQFQLVDDFLKQENFKLVFKTKLNSIYVTNNNIELK